MNKRILCLCFVLIALIGISGVSACYADNSTVVDSNLGLSLTDSVQSVDDGVELLNDQALEEMDDIDSKSEVVDDLNEDVSQEDCISIPSGDNAPLDGVDESAIDLKDNGFIINAAKDAKSKIPNTFMPGLVDKNLFAIEFDPETGMVKVNRNCSYMNTEFINSSTPMRWCVHLDNGDYMEEYGILNYYAFETARGYPNCMSNEFNLTACIKDRCYYPYATEGHLKCILSLTVFRDDDLNTAFSVDFKFPIVNDESNNVKYFGLEKSTVHISGQDIEIYDSKDPMFLFRGRNHYMPKVEKVIKEQKFAFCDMEKLIEIFNRSKNSLRHLFS